MQTIAKAKQRSLIQHMHAAGVTFLAGVVMTVWHLFTLRPEHEKA